MTDGKESEMSLNITLTADDLVKEIFGKIGQPFVHGYALFIKDGEKYLPIDGRFSLPHACFSSEDFSS
jgi:hypothetical protein